MNDNPFDAAIIFLQQQLDDVAAEEGWCREDGFIPQADDYAKWIKELTAAIRVLEAAGKFQESRTTEAMWDLWQSALPDPDQAKEKDNE